MNLQLANLNGQVGISNDAHPLNSVGSLCFTVLCLWVYTKVMYYPHSTCPGSYRYLKL